MQKWVNYIMKKIVSNLIYQYNHTSSYRLIGKIRTMRNFLRKRKFELVLEDSLNYK